MSILNYLLGSIFGFSLIWVPVAHAIIVILFGFRLISIRRPVGVVLAWFLIVVLFPLIGISLYILIGERPVGRKLTRKIIRMDKEYAAITESMRKHYQADKQLLPFEGRALSLLAESKNGSPVIAGNKIELFTSSLEILQHFIDEINQAKKTLHLEFYIWALGGDADRVGEALIAAAKRGVTCKVLLDSLGSKDWFKSHWPSRFRSAGIQVTEAFQGRWN